MCARALARVLFALGKARGNGFVGEFHFNAGCGVTNKVMTLIAKV